MNSAKFRVLVVEDEWPARNFLVELLEETGQATLVGAVASVHEALQVLDNAPETIDVVFMDVNLVGDGEKAGLDVVRRYSGNQGAPAFVLATAFKEHAIEAFDLGVIDYLVKPFTEERIQACLKRIAQRAPPSAQVTQPGRVVARKGKNLIFLEVEELWAFEAFQRLTYVHTRHGRYDIDLSLTSVEQSIGQELTRVHRNWLVQLPAVREFGRDGSEHYVFVGDGLAHDAAGIRVPVARDRSTSIRELLLLSATGLRR